MNLTSRLAVITGGAYAPAMAQSAPGRPICQTSLPSVGGERTVYAMLAVTALHMAALLALLHPFASNPPQQPVLSFTVTLMDLSSSQNTVSSAASAAGSPAEKLESKKIVDEVRSDARPAKLKKSVASTAAPSPKTLAPLSHSSKAQTAVLAPITPAQFDAAYLQNPAPVYPALSRRMGEQGNALLSVYVSENGKAETVRLKKSSGFARLDNAALEAVQRWRFLAAKQGERLIASWVQVPIKFVLE